MAKRFTQAEVDAMVIEAYNEGFLAGLRGGARADGANAIRRGDPAATHGAAVTADALDRGILL